MKERWLLNLILIGMVAALTLLVIFKPGKNDDAQNIALTELKTETIDHIRIQHGAAEVIVLQKTDDSWHLSQPLKARANHYKAESLARLAESRSQTRFEAKPGELGKYGLDKPQTTVWLNQQEIRFGDLHPLNNALYVSHQDAVYLIPAHYFASANGPYTDFINTRLLEESVKPVAIKLPGFSLTLVDGVWRREPRDEKLSADLVNTFIEEWRHAQALSVGHYGDGKILQTITMSLVDNKQEQDKATRTLELGILAYKPEFILYRKDEGLEYRFTEDTGTRLMTLKSD